MYHTCDDSITKSFDLSQLAAATCCLLLATPRLLLAACYLQLAACYLPLAGNLFSAA